MAAARSTLAIVKMLVNKGADIHATIKVGATSPPVPRDCKLHFNSLVTLL